MQIPIFHAEGDGDAVQIHLLQRQAVRHRKVADSPQVDGIVRSDAIDLLFGEIALLSELRGRMPCAADDPFAWLLLGDECLDRIKRLGNGLRPAHVHHVIGEAGRLEMRVGIDQPGNHGLARQVENAGRPANKGCYGGIASSCEYLPVPNGQCLHNR